MRGRTAILVAASWAVTLIATAMALTNNLLSLDFFQPPEFTSSLPYFPTASFCNPDILVCRFLADFFIKRGYYIFICLFVSLCSIAYLVRPAQLRLLNAPVHGYRWWFEPAILTQSRFTNNAMAIVTSGYKKFQERPFVVRRYDADITILPHKYLSELRLMPAEKLSAVRVQVKNMAHKYTQTSFLMESDLHFRVLQNKLIPDMPKYLELAKKEISDACIMDLPQADDWTEVAIQPLMRIVVARITSAVMVGYPTARDPDWLNLIIDYPGDMLGVAYTLRRFPPWMHPFVALFLPARYRLATKYKTALRILSPLMDEYARLKGLGDKNVEAITNADDTLLSWMLDRGDENETRYEEMAARQVLLSLASIHTTSMTVSNILFDLCEHPEWFSVLRAEIDAAVSELGPIGSELGVVQWLFRLEKMNSFIVETQRLRPPIILSPQREAMVPLTLHDGTHIPKGSRISWAAYNHLNSHTVTPNPERFDPMRSYRKRHAAPDEKNKHIAGQTDVNNLTFGYGKLACPGRAFAIAEVQMILVKILMDFDYEFPTGKGRPKDMFADEQMFPDPAATIMMRRREKDSPLD